MRNFCALFFFLIFFCVTTPLYAAPSMNVDIYGPGQSRLNFFLATPLANSGGAALGSLGNAAQELSQRISSNCAFLPFLHELRPRDILGGATVSGYLAQQIDLHKFQLSRTDILITQAWSSNAKGLGDAELRAYEVYTGRLIVGKGYTVANTAQIPEVAARFCADLMQALTGNGDFFRSNLAFVKREGKRKQIYMATAQGANLRKVTNFNAICMSPSWSDNGQKLVFVMVDRRRHHLCIWDRKTGRILSRTMPGSTIIAPTFTRRGTVAVSLDLGGNPDIYELRPDFSVGAPLEQNWGIDIGPDFDKSGQRMVFVSSRLGNPHVFLKEQGGTARRISLGGKYNTGPSISPDGTQVVYARRVGGQHKLFLQDIASGMERQLTFGSGSDEDPTWSPDGYFIAFASTRSGVSQIYITTKHGDEPILIPTGSGEAISPAWGKL